MDCVCRVPGLGGWLECPPEAKGQLFEHTMAFNHGMIVVGLRLEIDAKSRDYTGDLCSECGNSRMIRSGTCQLCLDCGSTNGGCS